MCHDGAGGGQTGGPCKETLINVHIRQWRVTTGLEYRPYNSVAAALTFRNLASYI